MARRSRPQSAVSAFVQSFMAGYKLFSDVERRRTKSEEDGLSKYDSRLGERNPLSKLFGGNSDGLSGPDRGRAILDAKIKQAYEKGDSSAIESLEKSRRLFEEQSKAYPYDDGNKIVDDKVSANESAVPLERPTDVASNDTAESALPVESSTVASAMPEGGVDYGTDFGNDYSLFGSRGGLVPKMHAALGGSAVRMDGGTGMMPTQAPTSALPIDDNNEEPVQEASDFESPSEETDNLGLSRDPQELADQAAPAVQAGIERINAALTSRSALPGQDPEYQAKLNAFARGEGRLTDEEVKDIDSVIDPDGSLPDSIRSTARIAALYKFYEDRGDPETASTLAARTIMRNKFESQTLGSLAKSAFEDGEMESGVKLLTDAYNKNMPDGRSMLASVQPDGSVAFKIGWDKLSGFETEQEGRADRSQLIQLASNTATGSEQMQRFMALANASKEAKAKEAKGGRAKTSGKAGDGAVDEAGLKSAALEYQKSAAAMRALPADATSEQREAAYAAANSAYQAALAKVPGAKLSTKVYNAVGMGIKPPELPGAVTSGGKGSGAGTMEERKAAKAEAQVGALTAERLGVEAGDIASRGIGADGQDVRPAVGRISEATAAETARRQFGIGASDFYAVDAGEGKAAERARTSVNSRRAAIGYGEASDAPGANEALVARASPYLEALEGKTDDSGVLVPGGLLNESKKDKNGNVDPRMASKLTQEERDKFTDIFGRLAKKNDTMSPRTLAQIVYDIANPKADEIMGRGPKLDVDFKTGMVKYNGRTFYADDKTLVELAAMRGARSRQFLEADRSAQVRRRDSGVKSEQLKKNAVTSAANAAAGSSAIPAENIDIRRLPMAINQLEAKIRYYEGGLPKISNPAVRSNYEQAIAEFKVRRDALRSRLQTIQK